MFVHRVARERHRGIRGGWEYIAQTTDLDDIGRMTATRAFRVIGVDRAALEGSNGVFHESGFIQRVCVNRDLNVEFLCDTQTLVDRGRCGPPIFVELQTERAGSKLFAQRFRQ